MKVAMVLAALAVWLSGAVAKQVPPHGTIVWSNPSLASQFAATSLALPNGDMLLVSLGAAAGGLTEDSLTLDCISHVSGTTLWSAPIAAPSISYWPGLGMTVGPRYGAVSGDGSAPVVVLTYGNGFSTSSMQVVDTKTGAILVPGQLLPLGFGTGGQASTRFVDGVLLLANMNNGMAAAITIPDQEPLFNVTVPLPYTPAMECVRVNEKKSCLAKPGCSWRFDIISTGSCGDVVWEVAGATGPGAFGNKVRPALALAHLASGSLALVGTRPRDVGNPAVGSLIAIDLANGQVRWSADNVTPHSIFVDDAAAVAVIGIEAPWDVPFRPTDNVSYTIGFRGYALSQGDILWDNTSKSTVQHSDHTGATVGPRACEFAYGQPCDLIAATPVSLSTFAMNTSTGQSICSLPSHVPATSYAIDTVNGVEYTVEGGELTASAAGTTGTTADGAVLWRAPLPPTALCLGGGSVWSKIVVGASKTESTKQPIIFAGGECCTKRGFRSCASTASGAVAVRAPAPE
eukprot:SAG31_NODE_902_length_11133_cov_4.169386_10_plen_516_part_00